MPSHALIIKAVELMWSIVQGGDFLTTEEELAGIEKFAALNEAEPKQIKTSVYFGFFSD